MVGNTINIATPVAQNTTESRIQAKTLLNTVQDNSDRKTHTSSVSA
jgi:hypothetical protein